MTKKLSEYRKEYKAPPLNAHQKESNGDVVEIQV